MLTDQKFSSLPLVVVGPEIFYDRSQALSFNLDRIFTFRSRIENFTFLYCGLTDSKYGEQTAFFKRLVGMGVMLQERIVVDRSALEDSNLRESVGRLFLNADLIYSPEFVQAFTDKGVPFTNRRNYTKYSAVFVGGLLHFSTSLEPFSVEGFSRYYNAQLPAQPVI